MSLVEHAKRELDLLGEEPWLVEGYLKIVKIVSDMGHSGGSASVFIPTLNRLLSFENLTPLTEDPEEWQHHDEEVWGEPGGIWQSIRNPKAFSKDGGETYYFVGEHENLIRKTAKKNP